jgi:hypothetical protein
MSTCQWSLRYQGVEFALLMSVINPPSVVAGENNIGKEEREMEAISR